MSKPAARLGDIGSGHGAYPPTPIIQGSPDVKTNGRPAARVGDALVPHAAPKKPPHGRSVAAGASQVSINGKPAARVGDSISCGGSVSTGSGNVFIGDSPVFKKPYKLKRLNLQLPHQRGRTHTPEKTSDQESLAASQSEAITYDLPLTALAQGKADAIDYWAQQKEAADNFPEYLAAHLMGLNAETGYSIAEGLQATYETVTDWDKFKGAMANLKDGVIDTVTDPMGTYQEIKDAAYSFSELPLSAQGEALYKGGLGLLAGGGSTKALGSLGKMTKSKKQFDSTHKKRFTANSLNEVEARLQQRRAEIAKNGYTPKYSDDELDYLAQAGDVGSERFQVRFMESDYLNHRDSPDDYLSGAMGMTMEGVTGKGAKYWSTSLDQIEDADTDPKLLSEKLGLDYDPKKDYSLIIVDTEKAISLTGMKSVPATFDEVGDFANTELPDDFSKAFTDKAMTPEFQAEYAKHHKAAEKHLEWEKDTDGFEKYLKSTGMSENDRKTMLKRMKMHDKVGNNQHYLGTGLTKDNIAHSGNKSGAVETLNFERKEVSLKQLNDAGAIKILKDIKPL